MGKIRLQMAPEVELRMDLNVPGVDTSSRDYDVQQHKQEVYTEFERRMKAAFPEGCRIDGFEFGLDRSWHKEFGTQ